MRCIIYSPNSPMEEPTSKNNSEEPSSNSSPVKPVIKDSTRRALAFIILCACTVLILFTGPGFSFGLQVVLSCLLLFFLFWLATLNILRVHKLSSRITPNAVKENPRAIKLTLHSLTYFFSISILSLDKVFFTSACIFWPTE